MYIVYLVPNEKYWDDEKMCITLMGFLFGLGFTTIYCDYNRSQYIFIALLSLEYFRNSSLVEIVAGH